MAAIGATVTLPPRTPPQPMPAAARLTRRSPRIPPADHCGIGAWPLGNHGDPSRSTADARQQAPTGRLQGGWHPFPSLVTMEVFTSEQIKFIEDLIEKRLQASQPNKTEKQIKTNSKFCQININLTEMILNYLPTLELIKSASLDRRFKLICENF